MRIKEINYIFEINLEIRFSNSNNLHLMDKSHIAIFAAVFVALAFRLYKRYVKKNQNDSGGMPKQPSFPSSSKDDDYEPYSKK